MLKGCFGHIRLKTYTIKVRAICFFLTFLRVATRKFNIKYTVRLCASHYISAEEC